MKDFDKYTEIIEQVDLGEYEPSEWEEDFLESIEDRLDSLTEKQEDKLEELYMKICK